MRNNFLKILASITILTCTIAVHAQVIPNSRTFIPAWNSSGHSGAIPNKSGFSVREFGAKGDGTTDDTLAIKDAITNAASDPQNKMVYFPAGVYKITSTLTLSSGIVLRGERNSTGNLATLKFDLNGANADCINAIGTTSGSLQPITPPALHDSHVDVQDASTFNIGDYVRIWQDDDPAWNYSGSDGWANHNEGQILKIENIIGSRLYVNQEIRAAYYSNFNPEIQKLSLLENIGLDNLVIERADTTTPIDGITVNFNLVANCWIRGCELIKCFRAHIVLQECTKIEITGNYIHDGYEFGGNGRAYGTLLQSRTGDCLIQNNIFNTLRHSMVFQAGPNGNVLGYNYSRNAKRTEFFSDYASDITFHGNRPYANLAEGNIVCAIQIDNSHGQGAGLYNTIFRNVATVCGLLVMSTSPKSDNQNIVGNDVLWTSFLGNYSITGSNHILHGNRYQASSSYTLSPTNTGDLSDYSYYLNTSPLTPVKPAWWTLSTDIPTIGIPTTWKSFTNSSKARWDSNGVKTVGTIEPVLVLKNIKVKVILQNYNDDKKASIPINIQLKNTSGEITSYTKYLDSQGYLTLDNIISDTYDIAFKAGHWLRSVIENISISP